MKVNRAWVLLWNLCESPTSSENRGIHTDILFYRVDVRLFEGQELQACAMKGVTRFYIDDLKLDWEDFASRLAEIPTHHGKAHWAMVSGEIAIIGYPPESLEEVHDQESIFAVADMTLMIRDLRFFTKPDDPFEPENCMAVYTLELARALWS